MIKKQTLFSDSIIYGISSISPQLVNFALLPIYTRYLTTADYGMMALLAIFSLFYILIAGLGLSQSVFRFYRDDGIDKDVLISDVIASLLLGSKDYKTLVIIVLLTSSVTSISAILLTVKRVKRQPIQVLVANLFGLGVQVPVSLWLVVTMEEKLLGMLVGIFSGSLVILIIHWVMSRSIINYRLNIKLLKKLFKYGIHIVPMEILSLSNKNISQIILRSLSGFNSLGVYSISARFSLPLKSVVDAIAYAYTGFFFQTVKEDKDYSKKLRISASMYVFFISYLWVGVSIWGQELMLIITPVQFHEGVRYIPVISMVSFLSIIYMYLSSGINMGKTLKPFTYVNFLGFVVNVISAYLLVKAYGAVGAAYASIASMTVMILISTKIANKVFRIKFNTLLILIITVQSVLFVLFYMYFFENSQPVIRLIYGFLLTVLYPISSLLIILFFEIERDVFFKKIKEVFNVKFFPNK